MRSRISLFALLLVVSSFVLPLVAHAGIPFFGPIIEKGWLQCPLGWGAVITVVNNIISLLITLAIVFVAPLMIAYAGFLLVVSQGDSGKRTEARKILTNTIVGIVIALAGWMIVAAIMAALYNPETPIAGGKLGVWSDLIGSRGIPPCIDLKGSVAPPVAPPPTVDVVPAVTVNINSGVVISTSAVNVLKDILRTANLTSATITSGRRTSDDQTRVMYDNLQTSGVANQKALYGPNGDAVIDVYAAQKKAGAGETTVKAAMKQKIEQLGCSNVSNHCSSSDVFDVAPSSISNGNAFRTAVQSSSAVKRYIFPPTDPAYHIEL